MMIFLLEPPLLLQSNADIIASHKLLGWVRLGFIKSTHVYSGLSQYGADLGRCTLAHPYKFGGYDHVVAYSSIPCFISVFWLTGYVRCVFVCMDPIGRSNKEYWWRNCSFKIVHQHRSTMELIACNDRNRWSQRSCWDFFPYCYIDAVSTSRVLHTVIC